MLWKFVWSVCVFALSKRQVFVVAVVCTTFVPCNYICVCVWVCVCVISLPPSLSLSFSLPPSLPPSVYMYLHTDVNAHVHTHTHTHTHAHTHMHTHTHTHTHKYTHTHTCTNVYKIQIYTHLWTHAMAATKDFQTAIHTGRHSLRFITLLFRGFLIRIVYLYYISCLKYTILVGNPQFVLHSPAESVEVICQIFAYLTIFIWPWTLSPFIFEVQLFMYQFHLMWTVYVTTIPL